MIVGVGVGGLIISLQIWISYMTLIPFELNNFCENLYEGLLEPDFSMGIDSLARTVHSTKVV